MAAGNNSAPKLWRPEITLSKVMAAGNNSAPKLWRPEITLGETIWPAAGANFWGFEGITKGETLQK